jgi:hypothetical protein
MQDADSLKALPTHFAFGRNRADYAKWITEERIAHARGLLGSGCVEYVFRRA